MGAALPERGGRRKKIYQVTNVGKESLKEARSLREQMWNQVPGLSLNISYAL